jgi:hypothetical protein
LECDARWLSNSRAKKRIAAQMSDMKRNSKHARVRNRNGLALRRDNRCMGESLNGAVRFSNEYLPFIRSWVRRFIKKNSVINYGYKLAPISAP